MTYSFNLNTWLIWINFGICVFAKLIACMTSQSLSGRENVNTSITHFGHQSHHCAKMDSIDRSTEAVFLPSFTLLVFQNSRSGYEITLVPISISIQKSIFEPKITHFGHQSHHSAMMDSIDWSTEAVFSAKSRRGVRCKDFFF